MCKSVFLENYFLILPNAAFPFIHKQKRNGKLKNKDSSLEKKG
jgi:hypothetical protein